MSATPIIAPALRAAAHVRSSKLNPELAKSVASYLSSASAGGKIALPDLAYDYASLEPSVSAETMEIHHSKHHNTYVANLNGALEQLDAAASSGDVSAIIGLQGALKFNGGGHLNHTLFWENLCPKDASAFPAAGPLKEAVDARFGGFEGMKKEVSAMTVAVRRGALRRGALFRPKSREHCTRVYDASPPLFQRHRCRGVDGDGWGSMPKLVSRESRFLASITFSWTFVV